MDDDVVGVARQPQRYGGTVIGALLAAGAGTRYGMPKILAEQGLWLGAAVRALDSGGCGQVLVAMGAAVVTLPRGATAVLVDDWAHGLSASVRAVIETVRRREDVAGVVLHVIDMPDVGAQVVSRVIAAAERRRDGLVRAVFSDQPGHPVYLGADHFDGVLATLDGDVGAAPYLRAHSGILKSVECGDLASGVDRDTP
ncbi:MAG: NTP transferase domain-containing protein [Gordonia sp. (in: high G+C Gram-positive bacteria)]